MEEIYVSNCINYVDTFCNICTKETTGQFCSDNPNCYYKQLKRKEKECEELKQALQKVKEIANSTYNDGVWNGFEMPEKLRTKILQLISEVEE